MPPFFGGFIHYKYEEMYSIHSIIQCIRGGFMLRAEDADKQELRERWDPQKWVKMDRNEIDFWYEGMERLLRSTALDKLKSILQPIPPPVSQWHDGTRTWMQKRFDDSVKNQTSKVMILAGEKGIGKTAIAGMLAKSVIAYHQLDHAESTNSSCNECVSS